MDTLKIWFSHPVWVPVLMTLGFFVPLTLYFGVDEELTVNALVMFLALSGITYLVCSKQKQADGKREVTDRYLKSLLGDHYKEMSHLEIYPGFLPIGYVETPDGKKHFVVVRGEIYEKVGDS